MIGNKKSCKLVHIPEIINYKVKWLTLSKLLFKMHMDSEFRPQKPFVYQYVSKLTFRSGTWLGADVCTPFTASRRWPELNGDHREDFISHPVRYCLTAVLTSGTYVDHMCRLLHSIIIKMWRQVSYQQYSWLTLLAQLAEHQTATLKIIGVTPRKFMPFVPKNVLYLFFKLSVNFQ